MAGDVIWAWRVTRLPLLDADGAAIGRITDLVLTPSNNGETLVLLGFVASSQRRRIFVNAGRISSIDNDGLWLRSWDVDLNPFRQRDGELLLSRDLLDKPIGDERIFDIALREDAERGWEVATIRLAKRRANPVRRRRSFRLVEWPEVAGEFATSPIAAEAARLRDMHPSDVAAAIRNLPLAQRRQLAAAMEDDRLADLLEELPEAEQLRLVEGLDLERLADVLEEMEYDDAADLLAEMPGEQRTRLLQAMDAEDADVITRLLAYEEGTAGSLMTPDVLVCGPTTTVAEALARVRDPEYLPVVSAQVFVTQPPFVAPTGTYLGVVGFQRLLREQPATELGRCVEKATAIRPDIPDREVAERLAAYNLLAVPVCDEQGRLLGAISVDDVLDRTLPAGWRQRRRPAGRAS